MPYVPPPDRTTMNKAIKTLSEHIARAAHHHGYDAAFAGELNYSLTRLTQELPRSLMSLGVMKEEMRYWIQPLMYGVLLDVVLEHKRRVNTAYEAHQIVKSGDCYDTPYYTKLVEVINKDGEHVGYQEVMLKRSEKTLPMDVIGTIGLRSQVGAFPLKIKKKSKSKKPKTKRRKKRHEHPLRDE